MQYKINSILFLLAAVIIEHFLEFLQYFWAEHKVRGIILILPMLSYYTHLAFSLMNSMTRSLPHFITVSRLSVVASEMSAEH